MTQQKLSSDRIICIDRARGFVVFCSIVFECCRRFLNLGILRGIASHGSDGLFVIPGKLTFADICAPMFFFLIALTFFPSLKRRIQRDGRKKAYLHFIVRNLALVGFGGCLIALENLTNGSLERLANNPENYSYSGAYTFAIYLMAALTIMVMLSGLLHLLFALLKKQKANRFFNQSMLLLLVVLGIVDILVSLFHTNTLFFANTDLSFLGVLQSIGGAGLFVLMFAEAPTIARGFAGAVSIGVFGLVHHLPGCMEIIDVDVQGGLFGVLSWGGMMLFFSVLSDLYYRDRQAKQEGKKGLMAHTYLIATAVTILLGIWGANMVVNKGSVSPGYVLASIPFCAVSFWLFSLTDKWQPRIAPLSWWGANPILMYLLQFLTQNIVFTLFGNMEQASIPLALGYVIVANGLLTWIAYRLYKKEIRIRL